MANEMEVGRSCFRAVTLHCATFKQTELNGNEVEFYVDGHVIVGRIVRSTLKTYPVYLLSKEGQNRLEGMIEFIGKERV